MIKKFADDLPKVDVKKVARVKSISPRRARVKNTMSNKRKKIMTRLVPLTIILLQRFR